MRHPDPAPRPPDPQPQAAPAALLEVDQLVKRFPVARGLFARGARSWLHAVDGVGFSIAPGESVGLVGESGCGKSTLARLLARLVDADSGRILFDGADLAGIASRRFARHSLRRDVQVVFQDPTDSLNPRYSAFDAIAEPVRLLGVAGGAAEVRRVVEETAAEVGLPPELLPRFPHQLSGGQKARVNIARAVAVRPRLLILDEPTAALDVSVQAIVLKLLAQLRERRGLSYLFVSHDLNVVRLMCDRVMVMYLGRIVEQGAAAEVFDRPAHPYTRLLVESLPKLGRQAPAPPATGEPTSPIDPDPRQCRYAPRCPQARPRCSEISPSLAHHGSAREVACHFPLPH
jgi:peptide/nickel transport system ATP-binding protein